MTTRHGWLVLAALCAAFAGAATAQQSEAAEEAKRAYETGDYPKTVEILKSQASQNPQNGEIYLWLAKAYFQMQDRDLAVQSAEKAVALDPDNSEVHEWLGRAYGEKASHAFWFSALSLAKKSRHEFETAVQLDGRNFSALQALIEYDCSAPGIAGGGEDKALPEIEQIAKLDAAEGHYARGNCRRHKNDFATADLEFNKALESDPKSADMIYDIGDYAMKRVDPDMLVRVADAGEKAAAGDPRGEFYRAVSFILRKEKLAAAEAKLRKYLETAPVRDNYPSPSWAHLWLGRALEEQNQPEAANRERETAVRLDPKNKAASEQLKHLPKH
ncbi:MAG TPA: tetratricopeptide repeat protein [Terriglobales bacterium]|nr:tetratricopeptide repeat protein [Terriglobales bacterium]